MHYRMFHTADVLVHRHPMPMFSDLTKECTKAENCIDENEAGTDLERIRAVGINKGVKEEKSEVLKAFDELIKNTNSKYIIMTRIPQGSPHRLELANRPPAKGVPQEDSDYCRSRQFRGQSVSGEPE